MDACCIRWPVRPNYFTTSKTNLWSVDTLFKIEEVWLLKKHQYYHFHQPNQPSHPKGGHQAIEIRKVIFN